MQAECHTVIVNIIHHEYSGQLPTGYKIRKLALAYAYTNETLKLRMYLLIQIIPAQLLRRSILKVLFPALFSF